MEERDTLTGLLAGGSIHEALKAAIQGDVQGKGVALGLLDVDHFGEINDTFGAATGDAILQSLASLLGVTAKICGKAFRIAGDEFAVVLPGMSLEQAFLHLETLRGIVATNSKTTLPDGRQVTVKIGVAQSPRDARDAAGLFSAASAALMSAGEQGRNVVCLPPNEDMVLKSCYYPATATRRLKALAERVGRKESVLLREALGDLLRKYDTAS